MTEKTKKIVGYASKGAIVLGSIGLYISGGSESLGAALVAGSFTITGIIVSMIKG